MNIQQDLLRQLDPMFKLLLYAGQSAVKDAGTAIKAWRAGLLAVSFGAGAAILAYTNITPMFESVARVEVKPNLKKILWDTAEKNIQMYDAFMQSQMARIYSKRVLDAAARSEKWTSVAGERASDKFIGLSSELEILHPRKTQYLQIVAYHRDPELAAADHEGLSNSRSEPIDHEKHLLNRVHLLQEYDELIASEPRNNIVGAKDCTESLRDSDQQLIASRVSEGVVHRLELIDVEKDHRLRRPGPVASPERSIPRSFARARTAGDTFPDTIASWRPARRSIISPTPSRT